MAILNHKKESKNIAAEGVSYNTETKTVTVPFKSFKDPKIITRYEYYNVPQDTWDALVKAESLGGAVNKLLAKGGFDYQKL